jgi:hypothetical protein
MRQTLGRGAICVLVLTGLLGLGTWASVAGGEKAAAGSKLFNGKDLTGWVYPGKKGENLDGKTESSDGRVAVENGAIVMKAKDNKGKGGIKDLYTQKEFGNDFVLKLQFKAGPKADSGVYIRGNQLQIRDFARRGEQKHLKNFKDDDWNDLVITVKGTAATYTVNGEELKPAKMNVPAKGPIGLQAETGQFEFRNIQIKEMD